MVSRKKAKGKARRVAAAEEEEEEAQRTTGTAVSGSVDAAAIDNEPQQLPSRFQHVTKIIIICRHGFVEAKLPHSKAPHFSIYSVLPGDLNWALCTFRLLLSNQLDTYYIQMMIFIFSHDNV